MHNIAPEAVAQVSHGAGEYCRNENTGAKVAEAAESEAAESTALDDSPPDDVPIEQQEFDRDSLHTLPLYFLPLKTPGLKSAKMIKNARLEGVIELFRGRETGSGQIAVESVNDAFQWEEGTAHDDYQLLLKLEKIPSYDVYSLRVTLRNLGIKVDEHKHLRLSKTKMEELTEYMRAFTEPLILHIYGDRDVKIESHSDLINLFRNANVEEARENLKLMASTLHIELEAVPKFLEDYGDVFLSLSYYKNCLEEIQPKIKQFLASIAEVRQNNMLKDNASLMAACTELETNVNRMVAAITGRFKSFDASTRDLWNDLSASRFHEVERLITRYHVTIGGTLCALTVKMDAWAEWFPHENAGSPMKRAEFIMSEMRQGMDKFKSLASSAEGDEGGLRFGPKKD